MKLMDRASVILCALLMLFAGCDQEGMVVQVDKDEENDVVISTDLSNGRVQCIAEDSRGFMWIGTFRGLNRYDGNEYHQYFCTYDSLGLPDNNIQDIMSDSQGRLWVCTANGVCRYTSYDSFESIPIQSHNKNARKLMEDSRGNILMYNNIGLFRYNPVREVFESVVRRSNLSRDSYWSDCFLCKNDDILILEKQKITRYSRDGFNLVGTTDLRIAPQDSYYAELFDDGKLLISGNGSLLFYDTETDRVIRMNGEMRRRITANGNAVLDACPLRNGSILMSMSKGQVFMLDLIAGTLKEQSDKDFAYNVPNAYITCLFEDSRRNIWFGTYDKGIMADYYYKETFNSDHNLNRLTGNASVTAVSVDKQGDLWISTLRNGLYVYHTATGGSESVDVTGLDMADEDNAVTHMLSDADGSLWISTSSAVMKCRYNGTALEIIRSYPVRRTMDFERTEDGTVWITTASTDIYYIPAGSAEAIQKQAFNTVFTFIPKILNIGNGRVMIAAFNQKLLNLNSQTGRLNEMDVPDLDNCIRRSVFIPTDMYQDSRGEIWIGTVSNGLLRFNPTDRSMVHISGISCSDVGSIIEDSQGNMWIGTMKGLNRYDRNTGKISCYYKVDGLGGDEFFDRAACVLPDGRLVFGGTDGLTMFNPAEVSAGRDVPLHLLDLHVHNTLVRPGDNAPAKAMLDDCEEIRLNHRDNSFSISFAALDYGEYERVHYYYMMDGFDGDWIDAGKLHSAYYANLPTGRYNFRVRITDNGEVTAGTERSIRVVVRPAAFNSWWAWIIYLTVIALVIQLLYKNTMRVVEAGRLARRAEMEKEQELRTNQMNMSFFANIAHEFRTPLTMIAGPVGQLYRSDSLDTDDKKLVSIAQRSVQRMFKLVNQLMDFNKLENDTLNLNVEETDIVKVLNGICDIFEFNAHEKGLTLNRYGLEDSLLVYTDSDKLEKIVYNLLSNAFKFTPDGGAIDVTLDTDGKTVKIMIADTGKGIPEDQRENIFKRYYQLDNQTKAFVNWGTGIGLYFSRRLAELHHGQLTAGNRIGAQGAVFTLTFPMCRDAYSDAELSPIRQESAIMDPVLPVVENEQEDVDDGRPTILVVDDDPEIVNYMRVLLSKDYRLIACLDADSALQHLRKEEPNIVLSDVAMPGKDGYELCREIKQDIQLSHIPVILVTAKITSENQVEGLNVGADAYVTKPFDPSVLSALIQSQLKNRERVRNILTRSTSTSEQEVGEVLSEYDQKFMDELYKLMEEELSNTELNINRITELLYMSRTKLYYKIKGLTGETPSAFFRTYKLNRAAELLKSGKYSVSEIVDKTGFSTQSHFSSVFKSKFGVSPSQYR